MTTPAQFGPNPPPSMTQGGSRLIGGLLLVLVVGAQLGWGDGWRLPMSSRAAAASEPARVRALGDRVVRVFRALLERPAEAACEAHAGVDRCAPEGGAPVCRREGASGVRLGAWLTDLPPPTAG